MRGEIMWSFKTKNFEVVATCEPDDDLDLSWDDTGEIREKLASGEYCAFRTLVEVYYRGAGIGRDTLYGSIYADPRDFFTEHYGIAPKSRAAGHGYGTYFTDMVRSAIHEARRTLANPVKLRQEIRS